MHIQCSNIGGITSKTVVRHTSIFSAVCPAHIRYSQLLSVFWKTDSKGIATCIYRRSISGPWYCRFWISSSVTSYSNVISFSFCLSFSNSNLGLNCNNKTTEVTNVKLLMYRIKDAKQIFEIKKKKESCLQEWYWARPSNSRSILLQHQLLPIQAI